MITYVDNKNAQQYRILYEKATRELMAHNSANELIAPENIEVGVNEPLIMPEVVTAEYMATPEGVYESGKYFIWNESSKSFELATEESPSEGETYYKSKSISSLNEYFSYIRNLAEINPIYTVLPLDEDTFNVDLNTRKIEVPSHFATNGISVQGDEIAEVLYFKVNRFFDAQDLAQGILNEEASTNDKMQIYIQWRSAQEGEDGKLIEGVSVPWVVDLESNPNYILFGWPISSKITSKAGEIQFAVRFFKFKDQKIVYSLSTLTQNLKVQPSLDFDISEKLLDILNGSSNSSLVLDDNTNMILDRLVNSEVIDGGVVAEKPYFFITVNQGPEGPLVTAEAENGIIHVGSEEIHTSVGLVPEFWLGATDDATTPGLLNQPIEFKVQGSSADGGKISYQWQRLSIDDNSIQSVASSNKFMITDDTEKKAGKVYYKQITKNGETGYEQIDDAELDFTPEVDEETGEELPLNIYERFSVATINGTGYYKVTIQNRVQNSMTKRESITMVVAKPLPALIAAEGMAPEKAVLVADEEFSKTLTVNAVPQDKSYLTYQWYYNKTGAGGLANATAIEGATEPSYTVVGSSNSSAENGAEGDGFYYVVVTSNMNNYPGITVDGRNNPSEGTRVTHAPAKLEVRIAEGYKSSYQKSEAEAIGGIKIQVITDPSTGEDRRGDLGDKITYQWYRYQKGANVENTSDDIELARRGGYSVDGDIKVTDAITETYVPTVAGDYYFCEVCNVYNGEKTYSCSPFFFISNDQTQA